MMIETLEDKKQALDEQRAALLKAATDSGLRIRPEHVAAVVYRLACAGYSIRRNRP